MSKTRINAEKNSEIESAAFVNSECKISETQKRLKTFLKEEVSKRKITHKMTQKEIAEKIGMSPSNFNDLLNVEKRKRITADHLEKLSDILGISIDEMYGRKKTAETSDGFPKLREIGKMIILMDQMGLIDISTSEEVSEVLEPYLGTDYGRLDEGIYKAHAITFKLEDLVDYPDGEERYHDPKHPERYFLNKFLEKYSGIRRYGHDMPLKSYVETCEAWLDDLTRLEDSDLPFI